MARHRLWLRCLRDQSPLRRSRWRSLTFALRGVAYARARLARTVNTVCPRLQIGDLTSTRCRAQNDSFFVAQSRVDVHALLGLRLGDDWNFFNGLLVLGTTNRRLTVREADGNARALRPFVRDFLAIGRVKYLADWVEIVVRAESEPVHTVALLLPIGVDSRGGLHNDCRLVVLHCQRGRRDIHSQGTKCDHWRDRGRLSAPRLDAIVVDEGGRVGDVARGDLRGPLLLELGLLRWRGIDDGRYSGCCR